QWLLRLIARETDLPEEEIGVDTKFLELGVDSILAVNVLVAMEKALGAKLSRSLMFDFFTVERLAAHIVDAHAEGLATLMRASGQPARAVEASVAAPVSVAAGANVASPGVGAQAAPGGEAAAGEVVEPRQ